MFYQEQQSILASSSPAYWLPGVIVPVRYTLPPSSGLTIAKSEKAGDERV